MLRAVPSLKFLIGKLHKIIHRICHCFLHAGFFEILIVALLSTWAYIFYDKSQTKETIGQLETRITNVDSARNAIQQEFLEVSAKADSLTQNNIQLQGALADRGSEIQKLKGSISNILKRKNASDTELAQAKQMISELNGKIDGLFDIF